MWWRPNGMRPFFCRMIRNETENAKRGLPSGITAKVNSLVDPEIISLLYEASQAGVPIKLIVRGHLLPHPWAGGHQREHHRYQHCGPAAGAQPHLQV